MHKIRFVKRAIFTCTSSKNCTPSYCMRCRLRPHFYSGPRPTRTVCDQRLLQCRTWATSVEFFDGRLGHKIFRWNSYIIHSFHWCAHKHRMVASNSATAYLIAATETTDFLEYLQILLDQFHHKHWTGLAVDSSVAVELATSFWEPSEPLNKIGLATGVDRFHADRLSFDR